MMKPRDSSRYTPAASNTDNTVAIATDAGSIRSGTVYPVSP